MAITGVRLSTLWVFVMINMAFADIIGFLNPGTLEEMMTMKPRPEVLLAFSVLTEIPIAMILVSLLAGQKVTRWMNVVSAIVTIVWVVGGASATASYLFFASIEVAALLTIAWSAWTWKVTETAA